MSMCHSASDRQIIDCEAPALIRPALNLISRRPDDRFSPFSPARHRELGVNTSAFVCLFASSQFEGSAAVLGAYWMDPTTHCTISLLGRVSLPSAGRERVAYVSNHACMQSLLRILVAKVKGRRRQAARVAPDQLQIEFCNRPLVQNFDARIGQRLFESQYTQE
jgi:hypothetical protein